MSSLGDILSSETGHAGRNGLHYFRRTRRGRITQVIRERYLRDDVGMGSLLGRAVIRDEQELDTVLSDEFLVNSGKQLLVLDTNVVLKQIDLLERESCTAFSNLVFCETVLRETKNIDLSIYNRVLVLLRDDKRCCVVFPNENHRETWRPREPKETPNDHNDRLIRIATKWYHDQLEGQGIAKVTLITNDKKCYELAKKDGLNASTIHHFVDTIKDQFPGIVDLLADVEVSEQDFENKQQQRMPKFPAHISEPEINRRLKLGSVVQGTFRQNMYNRREGSIITYSKDGTSSQKIILRGFQATNRAIDGDVVAVEIIEDAKVQEEISQQEEEEEEVKKDDAAIGEEGLVDEVAADPSEARLDGTKIETKEDTEGGNKKYGKVVGIVKRNWRQYCGSVDEAQLKMTVRSDNVLIMPVDQKVPKIRIRTKQLESIKDKRILVAIDSWDRYSSYPNGHFIRVIGTIGDRQTETAVLLHEHDIPTREFSKKVMRCLPKEGADWKVTEENSKGRMDLRHINVCSIDPPGCKDIDDALHVRPLENGNIEIGVHIADVTHFVRHGTPIDEEAAERGTSTYLVERRLDMLPGLLTTDICSLKGNVDRFAFSVIWEYTRPDDKERPLEQVAVKFGKSIIHSKAALSYGEAQHWIEDPSVKGDLPDSVRMLNSVAKILRDRRLQKGALTLASQEVRFKLDNDSHDPTDVEMYQQKEANALVEEFMLLANITVAKRIVEKYPRWAMLRRHQKPSQDMFEELRAAAKIAGFEIHTETSKLLADSLDRANRPDQPYFNKLIRILTTRCMMQAQYFTSGEYAPAEYLHYGLASPIYTHFTSPIRRYADVVVHRLLASAEGIDPLPLAYESKEKMKLVSDNLNKRHHMAQLAGRASIALHTVVFFRGRPTETIALISRVKQRGIVVVVPEYGIEGKVNFANTDSEAATRFAFEPEQMKLTHNKTGTTLQIFDQVKVRLEVKTSIGHRENLVIHLLEPDIAEEQEQGKANEKAKDNQKEPKATTASSNKRKAASGSSKSKKRKSKS